MRMIDFITETLRARKRLFISATALTVLLKLSTLAPALLLGRLLITSLSQKMSLHSHLAIY